MAYLRPLFGATHMEFEFLKVMDLFNPLIPDYRLRRIAIYYIIAMDLLNFSSMSTIFFKINDTQAKEVQKMMEDEGYTNKAEFFRFLIKFYKYNKSPVERNFEIAAKELGDVLRKLDKKGKLASSLDEQLADV